MAVKFLEVGVKPNMFMMDVRNDKNQLIGMFIPQPIEIGRYDRQWIFLPVNNTYLTEDMLHDIFAKISDLNMLIEPDEDDEI